MKSFLVNNRINLLLAVLLVLAAMSGLITPDHTAFGGLLIGLATEAFPVNPTLTAIAIGYRNPDVNLIADTVLPRVPTGEKFTYTKYDAAMGYTVPDTQVGRKSEPNMVDFGGTHVENSTIDYGLDDLVPNSEQLAFEAMPKPASGGPIDPQALSTMMLTSLVELDREVRVSNTVFNTANYVEANQQTLSGTSQWSDYANSNPLEALMEAIDSTLFRPNILVIGRQAWTTLRQHPKIVQAVFDTAQGAGVVDKKRLAEVLEIGNIVIGDAWVNTARKGQPANYVRTWGKHCSLLFSSLQAAQMAQPTYGFTAQFGTKIAGAIPRPTVGLSGGTLIRSGEKVKEVICCPDAGYFFQNCVA